MIIVGMIIVGMIIMGNSSWSPWWWSLPAAALSPGDDHGNSYCQGASVPWLTARACWGRFKAFYRVDVTGNINHIISGNSF